MSMKYASSLEVDRGDEKHTVVRACTREHSLVDNLGTRLIEASRLILERRLAGSVAGSKMDASMG